MATMMPFLWLVIMGVFLGGSFLYRRRMTGVMAGNEVKDAHARAGNVAQRMGLTVVTGDPNFNFYHTGRWQDVGQAMSRNVLSRPSRPDIEVRLEGTPGGRRVELIYVDRMRVEDHLLSRDVLRSLDMRIVVAVNAPFPDFEIYTRNPNQMMQPQPRLALPPQSFGDAMLDSQLILKTNDPRIAPPIADPIRTISGDHYVHVIGQGGVLTFRATEYAAMAFGDGDKLLFALDATARAIESAASAHLAARGQATPS